MDNKIPNWVTTFMATKGELLTGPEKEEKDSKLKQAAETKLDNKRTISNAKEPNWKTTFDNRRLF